MASPILRTTASEAASTSITSPRSAGEMNRVTSTRRESAEIAMPRTGPPSATLPVTFLPVGLSRTSVPVPCKLTNAALPSGVNATP